LITSKIIKIIKVVKNKSSKLVLIPKSSKLSTLEHVLRPICSI
jgi:hypothetical protein